MKETVMVELNIMVATFGVLTKPKNTDRRTCRRKVHYYDINAATEEWAELIEEGHDVGSMGVYVCGNHYHLGKWHRTVKQRRKRLCIWCGNWIRPGHPTLSHLRRCNKRLNF